MDYVQMNGRKSPDGESPNGKVQMMEESVRGSEAPLGADGKEEAADLPGRGRGQPVTS